MKNAKAVAWKEEGEVLPKYKIQISEITSSEKKEVKEYFWEWENTASGWAKNNTLTVIYTKKFKSVVEWEEWAKQTPFYLEELSYRAGIEKRVLLSKGSNK